VRNGGTWSFLTVLTVPTFFWACSSVGGKAAAPPNWQQVPVSIEFRLAKGAPGPDLIPAAMYGQGSTVYLERTAQLSNRDIARVEAEQTRIGKGLIVHLWHTKAGAQRIADLTAHHIGDSLAIMINSVVVAVPTIQQPLNPGTKLPSDIGVPLEPKEAMQLARAIAKTWPRKGGT
jgi:preprotein translocase subunit SecD